MKVLLRALAPTVALCAAFRRLLLLARPSRRGAAAADRDIWTFLFWRPGLSR